MTVPLALILYASAVMLLSPRLLTHHDWSHAVPRSGIAAWQACVGAVLASFVLLALTAVVPVDSVSFDVGHLLHACSTVLRHRYLLHDAPWVSAVSLLIAATTAGLVTRALVIRSVAVFRGRRRQRCLIDLLARERDGHGTHVLVHDAPLAYCIPGGRGRIVLTTAARSRLDPAEIAAVVAHERAHLRGRHDLVLFGADVAHAAFPWIRFFRTAREQLRGLVEMLADDQAARKIGREPLAAALVDLGSEPAPESALGATSHVTASRVVRLLEEQRPASLLRRAGLMGISGVILAVPWLIAVVPAWAARSGLCPLPSG